MKKIFALLTIIIGLVAFTGCSFKSSKKKADIYKEEVLKYSESDLLESISNVEDSCIIFEYKYLGTYYYKSAVIYKYENGYYYGVTNYNSKMDNALNKYAILNEDTKENAIMVGYDEYNSVFVFKFTTTLELTPVTFTTSDVYDPGTMIFSIGSDSQQGSSDNYDFTYFNILKTGVISRNSGILIQHNCMSSIYQIGSPLFDYLGNFVGLNIEKYNSSIEYESDAAGNTYYADTVQGINFAIDSNSLEKILQDIETASLTINQKVQRYVFGAEADVVYTVEGATTQIYTLPDNVTSGLRIKSVSVGNPFYGKIKYDDIITKINGVDFTSLDEFLKVFYLQTTKEQITLTYYRFTSNNYVEYTVSI